MAAKPAAPGGEEKEYETTSVVVAVRCRPFNEREKVMKAKHCIQFRGPSLTIYANGRPSTSLVEDGASKEGKGASHNYTFDFAYEAGVPQETVFNDIGRPVLASTYAGFNTCIFAYGQTGAGKSYSMMGPGGGKSTNKDPGLIPRICTSVFEDAAKMKADNVIEIAEAKEAGKPEAEIPATLDFEVQLTYLEIYQEKVKCLLNPRKDNLKVRQHPKLGVFVEGLTHVGATNYEQVLEYIEGGNNFRHVSATNMNETSSRSHAIFAVIVTQRRTLVTKAGEDISERVSKVNLVDLAGSERAKSTGAQADTLKEGSNINKSLTVLGQVISGLADLAKAGASGGGKGKTDKASFIPYRDSTLTYLLKENLGGNSKTFMMVALSPADVNYDETLGTLRYADRAKQIVTKACVNEDPRTKLIQDLQAELAEARRKMAQMEAKNSTPNAEVPSSIPKLKLGGGGKMPKPQVQKTEGPRTPTSGASSQRSSSSNQNEPDLMQEQWLNQTPRFPGQMEQFKAQAAVTETLLSEMSRTEDQRHQVEAEVHRVLEEELARTTVKANRNDPYVMNIEGGGDWVIEYLVDEVVYLAANPLKVEEKEDGLGVGAKILKIEPHDDIGSPHCCLIRQTNGDSTMPAGFGVTTGYILRPCDGYLTYIDDGESPIEGDIPLSRGQTIQLGDDVNIKFVDNTAPLPSSRKARMSRKSTGAAGLDRFASTTGAMVLPLAVGGEGGNETLNATVTSSITTPMRVPGLSLGGLSGGGGSAKSSAKGSPVPMLNLSGNKHKDPNGGNGASVTPLRLGSLSSNHSGNGGGGGGKMATTPRVIQIRGSNGGSSTPRAGGGGIGVSHGGSMTARGPNPQALGKAMPVLRTPRSTATARYAPSVAEEMTTVNRHTFVVLGDTSTGKSSLRQVFAKESQSTFSRFSLPFGSKKLPEVTPTLGFDSNLITAGSVSKADMTFLELSGIDSFASLQMMIPETRVTFIICWKMADSGDLSCFRKYLEMIQCRAPSSETNIILVATCRDLVKEFSDIDVTNALSDTQANLVNFLAALEPNESRRARVVHRFAVSNKDRTVVASGNKVKKMNDLLGWFADYATTRCKTDIDFPHSLVPSRVLNLEKRAFDLRQRSWMIPSAEYKTLARTVDLRYDRNIEELHKHTQILQSWGILHHSFRHMIMKKFVVLDVRWTFQVIVALSCCISPNTSYIKSNQTNQSLAATGGSTSRTHSNRTTPRPGGAGGPSSTGPSVSQRILPHNGDGFAGVIAAFADRLPFNLSDVYSRDPYGLVHQGVLTLPVANALFSGLMREKGMTDPAGKDLYQIIDLLEKHDLLMSGEKIFSRSLNNNSIHMTGSQMGSMSPKREESRDSMGGGGSESGRCDESVASTEGACPSSFMDKELANGDDSFYLVPSCFNAQVPSAVTMHLAPLLFGPTLRFSLNTVPPFFFSRLVVRISVYAQKLYVGPVTKVHPTASENGGVNNGSFVGGATSPLQLQSASFWGSCVWVVSSDVSRALIRMVQRSIFITFHDPCDDIEFREGVATAVQSLISEFPGVRVESSEQCAHCCEWIAPAPPEDYYQQPDTPVSRSPKEEGDHHDGDDPCEDEEDEEYYEEDEPVFVAPPCPQCNKPRFKTVGELLGQPFDKDDALAEIKRESFLLDDTEARLQRCFKHIQKGRKLQQSGQDTIRGSRIDGAGLDSLIDALATS